MAKKLNDIIRRYTKTLETEYSLNVSDDDFEWLIQVAERAERVNRTPYGDPIFVSALKDLRLILDSTD